MFLSLSHSLLSPRHISSSFSFSCISPSPPFFPQQRSRPHFFHSCVLRSAPTHSPHSSIPPGTDTVSCHPIKALIYCISQIGDFSYLHIASFCLFLSLIFLLHPPVLAQSLSAGVKKYPGSRQSWHQGERCVDPWRISGTKRRLNKQRDSAVWCLEKTHVWRGGFATDSHSLTSVTLLPSLFATLSSLSSFCVFCLPSGIAPNITAGPSDSTVIDGMSVILHCETSGAPRPAITWQKGLC